MKVIKTDDTSKFRLLDTPVKTGALAYYPQFDDYKQYFTSRYGLVVNLFKKVGEYYGVPRELAPELGVDERSKGIPFTATMKFQPRDEHQERIIRESKELLSKGKSHIIQASTGIGKSYCAINLAVAMGMSVLIVTNKSVMMDQWRREVLRFTDIPEERIGMIRQHKRFTKDKWVVIGMVQTLMKDRFADLHNAFGMVIFDEVHHMGSDHFNQVCSMFNSYLRLGLSATPKRGDGKEVLFKAHIGEVRVVHNELPDKKPKIVVVNSNWKCPGWITKLDAEKKIEAGRTMHISKLLAKDMDRNHLIMGLINKAYRKGRYTVVFSDLLHEHILPMRDYLISDYDIPEEDIGIFCGTMHRGKKFEEQRKKKIVLTTYTQCSEAVDEPRWDTAVFCMPKARIKQSLGRILRPHATKAFPIAFDIVDLDLDLFFSYYRCRMSEYKELGAEVTSLRG